MAGGMFIGAELATKLGSLGTRESPALAPVYWWDAERHGRSTIVRILDPTFALSYTDTRDFVEKWGCIYALLDYFGEVQLVFKWWYHNMTSEDAWRMPTIVGGYYAAHQMNVYEKILPFVEDMLMPDSAELEGSWGPVPIPIYTPSGLEDCLKRIQTRVSAQERLCDVHASAEAWFDHDIWSFLMAEIRPFASDVRREDASTTHRGIFFRLGPLSFWLQGDLEEAMDNVTCELRWVLTVEFHEKSPAEDPYTGPATRSISLYSRSLPGLWKAVCDRMEEKWTRVGPILPESRRVEWRKRNMVPGTPITDMGMYKAFGKQPLLEPLDEFVPWWLKVSEGRDV
jgi:hypothetical protein